MSTHGPVLEEDSTCDQKLLAPTVKVAFIRPGENLQASVAKSSMLPMLNQNTKIHDMLKKMLTYTVTPVWRRLSDTSIASQHSSRNFMLRIELL